MYWSRILEISHFSVVTEKTVQVSFILVSFQFIHGHRVVQTGYSAIV